MNLQSFEERVETSLKNYVPSFNRTEEMWN